MFKYAILTISMLFSVFLYSADTSLQNGDAAEPTMTIAVAKNSVLLNKFHVTAYFARPPEKKLLEGLEHWYTSYELVFLLATDPSTEPKISPDAFANAKTFVVGLQQAIEEKLTAKIKTPQIRDTLRHISKHALYFCRTCCELELKNKKTYNMDLGEIWAEHPLKWWKLWGEYVDAATFYKACAFETTFYSKKTEAELNALLEATK
jgi:hypothetical protein